MTLILVRHGQTEMNRGGRFQGRTDSMLTELGETQADMVAATLADSGATAVVSSPLRATQTAERIATRAGVAVEVDERLIEIDYGTWDREPLSAVSNDSGRVGAPIGSSHPRAASRCSRCGTARSRAPTSSSFPDAPRSR